MKSANLIRLSTAALSAPRSQLIELLALATRPGITSLALGLPDEALFPTAELMAAADELLRTDPGCLQYRLPSARLRSQVRGLLAQRGIECEDDQIFLTNGINQGIQLVARLLLDPGGEVVVEEVTYEGFVTVVRSMGARFLTVPSHRSRGMDLDALERLLVRGSRPAFIYAIPTGHNPLGVSLGALERARLVGLARNYEVPVVEDDAYGLLSYEPLPAPSLAALDADWVVHLGSFSKILAPALRVGWLVVPKSLVEPMAALKRCADLGVGSFSQHLVASFLAAGHLSEHLTRLRCEYSERCLAVEQALESSMPPQVTWSRPTSGMFIWLELPAGHDTAALLEEVVERDEVAYSPGGIFAVNGGGRARSCLRLSFASHPPERLAEAVGRLASGICRALDEGPWTRVGAAPTARHPSTATPFIRL